MQVLHNLGKDNEEEISKALGCNAKTVKRVLDALKETGSFLQKKKNETGQEK